MESQEATNGVTHQEMPKTIQHNTCGKCRHAVPFPQDITKRTCFGSPPVPVAVRAVGPNVEFRMVRPMVGIAERACALFQPNGGE